jgi:hypothetical protein
MKQGSSNLGEAAKKCEGAMEQPTANTVVVCVLCCDFILVPVLIISSPYNEARHRAICAIRCAANKRSFASQDDQWYRLEVELLRPGTIPPSSKIVARDVGIIYSEYAKVVRWYFEVLALLFIPTDRCAEFWLPTEAGSGRSLRSRRVDSSDRRFLLGMWVTMGAGWGGFLHGS